MSKSYRAAYWLSADMQSTVVLTTPDDDYLSDDDLITIAKKEADKIDLEVGLGTIEIGPWTD